MIVLIIGASKEAVYAIELAKKMGHRVLVFDGNPEAEGLSHGHENHVTDIRNYRNIITCLGRRSPDLVLPTPVGRILTVSGQINDYYGLRGVSAHSADLCTDKYQFHLALAGKGLRGGMCRLEKGPAAPVPPEAFPVILKPRFGAGSRNVYALADAFALKETESALAEEMKREDYVLESMARGQEYGVDGLCLDGKVHVALLRKKLLTPPPARQCVGYLSVLPEELTQKAWESLSKMLTGIMEQLGIRDSVFHGDLIDTGDGFFPIEVSARPSGHRLHDVFTPLVTGVSVLEAYLRHMAGETAVPERNNIKKSMIRYFDFESCRIGSVPQEAFLRKKYHLLAYWCSLVPGQVMTPVTDGHSLMGRGYFVLEGDSDESLESLGLRLLKEFEIRAV